MGRTRKPAQTEEQKIAALENRVKLLSGAVLTLEGLTKELSTITKENAALKERLEATDALNRAYANRVSGLSRLVRDREDRLTELKRIAINGVQTSKALAAALKAVL